jgi:phage terminase large subunit GpA-like protein
MGSNWIGYVIHHAPGPMMAVWPTVEMAKRNSKQRIDPLIEESAALAELIAPARSRDSGNTILAKEFRGGVLVMTGANSAVGFPVREWQKMRERNEALDCYVYARAAASAAGLDRFEERHWRELERQLGMERPPDEPPPIQAFDPDEATHSGGLAASGARHSGRRVIKSRWLTR